MARNAENDGNGTRPEKAELFRRIEALERREAELLARLSLHERVLDALPDHIVIKDRDGRFVHANRAACEYHGARPGSVVGKTEEELGWSGATAHAEQDAQALAGTLVDVPAEGIARHDGKVTSFHVLRGPMRDERGEIRHVFASARGIRDSERKSEHNEALLNVIPDMYFRFDRAGTFLDFSAPRGADTAVPPAVFLGKRVGDILPDIAPRLLPAVETALRTGEMVTFEYRIFKQGVWMDYEARVLASGAEDVIVLARDISAQKQAREELVRMQEARLVELSTPLIPISDEILVMPLIGSMDDRRAERVMERLLGGVAERGAEVVILDVTGMSSVTAETAGALVRCALATRLLGAEVLLTGMRAEVAQTLLSHGVSLPGIETLATLKAGIAHAMRRRGARGFTRS